MANSNIAERLNLIVKNYSCENGNVRLNFIQGDFVSEATELAFRLVPFGKVGFVCYNNTFEAIGKKLIDSLKRRGNKPIAMIFKNGSEDSLKFASEFFGFPEDVRLIIVSDEGLYRLSSYFAKIRGVPIVCGLISSNASGILDSVIYIKNGQEIDKIKIRPERYVIVDDVCIEQNGNAADFFARIMAETVTLIDCRTTGALTNTTPPAFVYGLLRDAVVESFNAVANESPDLGKILCFNALKAEFASAVLSENLLFGSAVAVAYRLSEGLKETECGRLLQYAVKILGVYEAYFNCRSSVVLKCVDYNERVDALVEEYRLSETQCLESLRSQLEIIKKGRSRAESVKFKMKKEVTSLYRLSGKMLEFYSKLGGKAVAGESLHIKRALRLCGDTPYGFNTMSLAREAGVTEFI